MLTTILKGAKSLIESGYNFILDWQMDEICDGVNKKWNKISTLSQIDLMRCIATKPEEHEIDYSQSEEDVKRAKYEESRRIKRLNFFRSLAVIKLYDETDNKILTLGGEFNKSLKIIKEKCTDLNDVEKVLRNSKNIANKYADLNDRGKLKSHFKDVCIKFKKVRV